MRGPVKIKGGVPPVKSGLNGLDTVHELARQHPTDPVFVVGRLAVVEDAMVFGDACHEVRLQWVQVEGLTGADADAAARLLTRASDRRTGGVQEPLDVFGDRGSTTD